jgi:hypothetical protein
MWWIMVDDVGQRYRMGRYVCTSTARFALP